jgi:hypothetical protein
VLHVDTCPVCKKGAVVDYETVTLRALVQDLADALVKETGCTTTGPLGSFSFVPIKYGALLTKAHQAVGK